MRMCCVDRVGVFFLVGATTLVALTAAGCDRGEKQAAAPAKPAQPSAPTAQAPDAPKSGEQKPPELALGERPKYDRSGLPAPIKKVPMPGDVVMEELKIGDGPFCLPAAMATMRVVGTLEDGTIFIDTRTEDPVTEYDLLQLMPGMKDGVVGMRVGGKRRLTIPGPMALGSRGMKDPDGYTLVPPDATVVVDIELLGVRQKLLKPGEKDPFRPDRDPKSFTPVQKTGE